MFRKAGIERHSPYLKLPFNYRVEEGLFFKQIFNKAKEATFVNPEGSEK